MTVMEWSQKEVLFHI